MTGKNSLSIHADTSGLQSYLAKLSSASGDAVRPAAQAAAEVLYKQAKNNVERLSQHTGKLAQSIYHAYSRDNSIDGISATYHVSWNAKKSPHGHLVENGYWQRYVVIKTKVGWRTILQPEMRGVKPIGVSRKDVAQYYIPLANPKFIPGKAPIRGALSALPQAVDAAKTVIIQRIENAKHIDG